MGTRQIQSELIKSGSEELLQQIYTLIEEIWKECGLHTQDLEKISHIIIC